MHVFSNMGVYIYVCVPAKELDIETKGKRPDTHQAGPASTQVCEIAHQRALAEDAAAGTVTLAKRNCPTEHFNVLAVQAGLAA
jgi:hypothetical protein